MTDERPSIAELQRDAGRVSAAASGWTYSRDRLVEASSVLVEIAAAAHAYWQRCRTAEFEDDTKHARRELFAALSKVLP